MREFVLVLGLLAAAGFGFFVMGKLSGLLKEIRSANAEEELRRRTDGGRERSAGEGRLSA